MKNKINTTNKLLRVFQIKSLSIYQLTLILLLVSSIISVVLISAGWAISEIQKVKNEISELRETAIDKQEEELKAEVSRLINYLEYIQQDTVYHSFKQIQDETLSYFESIRFGNDGYVFVNTYRGNALLYSGKKLEKPVKMSSLNYPKEIDFYETEMALARLPQGGSFQYNFKKINDSIAYPKMSYIMGFDEWGWIIGAGDYLEYLDNEIVLIENKLKSDLYHAILEVAGIFSLVLIILLLISSFAAESIQNQFNTLVEIIKQSSFSKEDKQPFDQIYIRELKTIAYDIAHAEERVQQFGNIIEQSQNEIYIFNQNDLHFVHVNKGAIQNCGYSISELQKMTPLDIKPKLNKEQFFDLIKPLKQNKKEQIHFETFHERKDKSLYPVDVHLASSIFNETPVYVAFIFDISVRKEAENQLRLSQQRYSDLFNNAPISLWEEDYSELITYLDIQLKNHNLTIEELFEKKPEVLIHCSGLVKVLDVNNYTLKLYQAQSKEDLLGSLDKIFTDSSFRVFSQCLTALHNGKTYFSAEGKNKTLKGKELDLLLRWSFLPHDNGSTKKVIVSAVDITELRKTEKELQESEERYRIFFENNDAIILFVEPQSGNIIFANEAAAIFYGYKKEDFLQMNVSQLNILRPEEIKAKMAEALQKKQNHFVFQHKLADGSIRDVEVYQTKLSLNKQEVFSVLIHDITDRKVMQDALIQSKNLMHYTINHNQGGVAVHDKNLNYIFVSQSYLEHYNVKEKDVIGKHHYDVFPDLPQKWRDVHQKALLAGEISHADEDSYEREDGSVDWTRWECRPWYQADGSIGGIIVYTEVITKYKLIEEELKKHRDHLEEIVKERTDALNTSQEGLLNLVDDLNHQSEKLATANSRLVEINEELETFTYSVSHDLKAPLRGIDGYSQLLLESFENELNPEANQFLENIRKSAAQMNLLIEDLLAYSRMERRDFQSQEIVFRPFINSILLQFSNSISENKVKIITSIPEKFSLFVDKDGLTLILRNLIENALKFSTQVDKPQIEIGCSEDNEKWLIFVKDNGIGFDMKYHDRIFKIFQRLHLAEEYEGTGIGLAMVSKAMMRMNGKIWAESDIGKGAAFYLEIKK